MEEQEVDLRDYINVMIKRKWTIINIFLVSIIATAVISLFLPKVYKTDAVVGNGYIDGDIIKTEDSVNIITSTDVLAALIKKENMNISISDLKKMIDVKDIKKTSYLIITARGKTPEEAKGICGFLAKAYINYGNELYRKRESLRKKQLADIEARIIKVKADVKNIDSMILKLSSDKLGLNPETMSKVILLKNILSGYRGQITGLSNQRDIVKYVLVKAMKFRIIDKAIAPEYPVKPKKKVMVGVAGMLSLIMGIFIAFFAEFWQKQDKGK